VTIEEARAWRDSRVSEYRDDAQILRDAGEHDTAVAFLEQADELSALDGAALLEEIAIGKRFVEKCTSQGW